jgi:thiamine biosynthesis lipoprotein
MARLLEAVVWAGEFSGGLVDATLVGEIERAGYAGHFESTSLPLAETLAAAPQRTQSAARAQARWREIDVNREAGTVRRPPGVRVDSGGLGKGLFADIVAETLAPHASFAVDCGGDLRLGGAGEVERAVEVRSPFAGELLHTFARRGGGVATSGIGKRSWRDGEGRPAHHLLDPATGRPAFTGVAQVTALAPTALEAEARAKAALLAGPARAADWLAHGGVAVLDDGTVRVLEPPRSLTLGGVRVQLRPPSP